MENLTQKVARRFLARMSEKATYWFEVKGARNKTVKEYEHDGGGTSGISGDFFLQGVLHIKPEGATWDAVFPFQGMMSVTQEPRSQTYWFTARDNTPLSRLVNMAVMNYSVENTIVKALGRLELVPED